MARRDVVGSGGGGGGGGGSSYVPREDPNTLQSRQYARFLDVVSEGPIRGFVKANPLSSLYLDETPVVDPGTGIANFSGITYDYRLGTQDQTHIDGFSAVEAETGVSTKVTTSSPIVRTFANVDADAVRVTLSVPTLTQTTSRGDMVGTAVQYKLEVQSNGGGYKAARLDNQWESSAYSGDIWNGISTPANAFGIAVSGTLMITSPFDTHSRNIAAAGITFQYKKPGDVTWRHLSDVDFSPDIYGETNEQSGIYYWHQNPQGWNIISPVEQLEGVWQLRAVPRWGSVSLSVNGVSQMSWVTTGSFSGKATSKYQRAHYLNLKQMFPGQVGPWSIKVTRLTADSGSVNLQNDLYFDSYTEIIEQKLRYPNSALVFLQLDAKSFNQVPVRGYEVYGLKVKIPSNYNPDTRNYTGSWDGTFKLDWTNNPAWIFYDILTNRRYGLGDYIDDSYPDKWGLYDIAQYCDSVDENGNFVGVADGFGGREPRFTCNLYLQSKEEAYKVVTHLASIFRGMAFWSTGLIVPVADKPTDPIAQFNPANVIGGSFTYSGSSMKARHTVALVAWNDPADMYRQKTEYVEDAESIRKYGVIEAHVTAYGCTSRGQAHRFGKWLIYTEKAETETIVFRTGLEGTRAHPGAVIKTLDPNRAGSRLGGRILASTTTELTLDSTVTLASGVTYTVSVMLPDGSMIQRGVVNTDSDVSTLTLTSALPQAPQDYAIWILESSELEAETWRVISITEAEPTVYEITALAYNPDKFAAVEQGLSFDPRPTFGVPLLSSPPTNLVASDTMYFVAPRTIGVKLHISWQGSGVSYRVQYRPVDGNWKEVPVNTNAAEIAPVEEGSYEIKVISVDGLGRSSNPAELTYTVVGKTAAPAPVTGLTATLTTAGIELAWEPIADIDLDEYEVRIGAAVLQRLNATRWVYPETPFGSTTFSVYAKDTSGNYSAATSVSQSVTAPTALTVEHALSGPNIVFTITEPTIGSTQLPVAQYAIRYGASFATGIEVFRGNNLTVSIPATFGGVRNYHAVAYDTAGNASASTLRSVTINAPSAPGSFSYVVESGSLLLKWVPPASDLPIDHYELVEGASWGVGADVSLNISADSFRIVGPMPGTHSYHLRAVNSAGTVGAIAGPLSIDVTVASAPTSLASQIIQSKAALSWNAPLSMLPIAGYLIKRGAPGFDWGTAEQVATINALSFRAPVDWVGTKAFRVAAFDDNGNLGGISAEHPVSIGVPAAPVVTLELRTENIVINWTEPSSSLPIEEYELWHTSVSPGNSLGRVKGNTFQYKVDWAGERAFYVAAIDVNGNVGAIGSTSLVISAPSASGVTAQVIDNNVLLYWDGAVGTLPIATFEIRRGASWATAELIGEKSGGFTSVFETTSGTYTYWVAAIDSAGNVGVPASTTTAVSQPPDYVLKASYASTFTGTKSNMVLNTADGSWIMPANPTETFAEHFTSNAWASPQAQVTAGYPIYIQPGELAGYYEETLDYGATLAASKVTLTLDGEIVSGTPDVSITLSVKLNAGDAWTDHPDVTTIYATNYRYIKYRIDVTGGATALYKLRGVDVKLDAKIINDAGSISANAADSGGTTVPFNISFIDVESITVSPHGTTLRHATYDFTDTPYPTSFKVLLFDAAGNRVSGTVSWAAKGY